tara:strand:+ start:7024 stop:7503 length:480 start_codon:yes stop_codon:yes gene_type:complete
MQKRNCIKSILWILLLWAQATFAIDTFEFSTIQNKQQALNLARDLRCPQCQNQNLVDSNSPIAKDLRLEVYKQVEQGASDEEIMHYMTQRYGDFILYQPRFNLKTGLLWFAPLVFLFLAFVFLFFLFYTRDSKQKSTTLSAREQDVMLSIMQKSDKTQS